MGRRAAPAIQFRGDRFKVRAVTLRRESLTVCLDHRVGFTFDPVGRPFGVFADGRVLRRGLDHRVQERWVVGGERQRRDLSLCERRALFDEVRQTVRQVCTLTLEGEVPIGALDLGGRAVRDEVERRFGRILDFDPDTLEEDGARFRSLYFQVALLPPDQARSVFVQAALGCQYNRCTFCDLYRRRRFRIRSAEEFRQHLQDVKRFFGESLAPRRSIFLGDANALVIPQPELLELLRAVNREFPLVPPDLSPQERGGWHWENPSALEGMYAYVDVFSGCRTPAEFGALRALGLRRVYLGVESGCDELLRFANKPATARQALEAVRCVKAGGLAVGVQVLAGLGGHRYAAVHVRDTVALLNDMDLGEGDIIYITPLVQRPETEYATKASAWGVRPLSGPALRKQIADLKGGLTWANPDRRARVAVFDIRDFLY